MVGVKGFEPPAPCSQSTYATKLRYTPLDPVAVTAVGFAPDDEIYLTIPASICQHLFSIFPKKLLSLSSSLRSAPWLPCVRGAVRRRAGLKGCPLGVRGKGKGKALLQSAHRNLLSEGSGVPHGLFMISHHRPCGRWCFARLIRQTETPDLQVRFARPPNPSRPAAAPINCTRQNRVSPPRGCRGRPQPS